MKAKKKKLDRPKNPFAQIDNFNNEFLVSKNILVESLSKLRILELSIRIERLERRRKK